jgi:hypothetical protein
MNIYDTWNLIFAVAGIVITASLLLTLMKEKKDKDRHFKL